MRVQMASAKKETRSYSPSGLSCRVLSANETLHADLMGSYLDF